MRARGEGGRVVGGGGGVVAVVVVAAAVVLWWRWRWWRWWRWWRRRLTNTPPEEHQARQRRGILRGRCSWSIGEPGGGRGQDRGQELGGPRRHGRLTMSVGRGAKTGASMQDRA